MTKYKLIFFSFLLINYVQAQALIQGVVRDASTKENLEFVSVLLNNSFKGTSTNAKGEFSLEIPDYSSSRSFSFQRVGYHSKTLSMVEFMRSDTIYLEIDEQYLSEVVIRPVNAFELLQEAIKRIPDNYYSQPVAQDIFYRQSVFLNEQLRGLEESRYHLINTFQRPKLPRSVSVKKARGFSNLEELKDLGKLLANSID
ncbi:MAG: carboxypeptidase-like regulatory domain-containing protein, partial [Bacteroidetes bacterium]|nr:carboxypeptidase-like regulatory domain-containing protein [Bacteroidota bacterium]